jgi:hypothetical protein
VLTSNPADARFAILSMIAEDQFQQNPVLLQPPDDPRLEAMGLVVKGHVTAVDLLLDLGRQPVNYGFLAEDATGAYILAIRGTMRALEWAKDLEGMPIAPAQVAHPFAGRVHEGFWTIFSSMRFLTTDGIGQPLAAGLSAVVDDAPITFTGHSLGGPLATYAAYDLSTLDGGKVSLRVVESPRPGDATFSAAVSAAVPDHAAYEYEPDLVTKLPFGFGYAPLANLIELPKNPAVCDTPFCNHHAWVIAWLLNPAMADAYKSAADAAYVGCLSTNNNQYAACLLPATP